MATIGVSVAYQTSGEPFAGRPAALGTVAAHAAWDRVIRRVPSETASRDDVIPFGPRIATVGALAFDGSVVDSGVAHRTGTDLLASLIRCRVALQSRTDTGAMFGSEPGALLGDGIGRADLGSRLGALRATPACQSHERPGARLGSDPGLDSGDVFGREFAAGQSGADLPADFGTGSHNNLQQGFGGTEVLAPVPAQTSIPGGASWRP